MPRATSRGRSSQSMEARVSPEGAPMTPSSAGIKIPFTEHLGVEIVEMTKEHAVVSLKKRPELLNSWGATHGGVMTVDLSVGFMKGSFGDKVTAEGKVLHGGKSTAFCEAEARDDKGALLAKAIGTFKLLTDKEKKSG